MKQISISMLNRPSKSVVNYLRSFQAQTKRIKSLDARCARFIGSSRHFRTIIIWTVIFYDSDHLNKVERYISDIVKILESRGVETTVKYYKTIRNIVTKYYCGDPVFHSERIRIIREGWPFRLRFLYNGTPDRTEKQFVLTLLCFLRGITKVGKPDLSPIIGPATADISWQKGWIERCFRHHQYTIPVPKFSSWHLTTKSGPYGHALSNMVEDWLSLTPEMKENLQILGGKRMKDYLERISLFATPERIPLLKKICKQVDRIPTERFIGKLNMVPDAEAKTRVIAQMNYFIQAGLRPLHEEIMGYLAKIPQDLTYDQGSAPSKIVRSPGSKYHSLDLSSATDRFPREIQRFILEKLFPGTTIGDAWDRIMSIPFSVDHKIGGGVVSTARYAVGQPMGSYSSWAVFTLTHHIIIHYCIEATRTRNKRCYVILGDDVVIADDKVARVYLQCIKSLGVSISPLKSHTSANSYEIAKRWFKEGEGEYTPWSTNAIAACGVSPSIIIQTLYSLRSKGWSHKDFSMPVVAFLHMVFFHLGWKTLHSKYLSNLWRLTWGNYLIDKVLTGKYKTESFFPALTLIKGWTAEQAPLAVVTEEVRISLVNHMRESVQNLGKSLHSFLSSDIEFLDKEPAYQLNDPKKPPSLWYWPPFEFIDRIRDDVIRNIGAAFDRKGFKVLEWKDLMRVMVTPNLSTIMVARDTEVRAIITSLFFRKTMNVISRVVKNNGDYLPSATFGKVKFLARRTGERYKFIN